MKIKLTNEEKEAIELYKSGEYQVINQLLVSDSNSDIALLREDVENKSVKITYDRETLIKDLKAIKVIYELLQKIKLKRNKQEEWAFIRGTNIAEVERFRTETFIDKCLDASSNREIAEKLDIEERTVYYWQNAFPSVPNFVRDRDGDAPNNLLNYGYAILRAIVARALAGSGLLPTLGIHHRNKYNAYCLADDVMEPYRPYVDRLVMEIFDKYPDCSELTKELKMELLQIPVLDVTIGGRRSPLMVAVSTTTSSLQKCYSGELRKIAYPIMDI